MMFFATFSKSRAITQVAQFEIIKSDDMHKRALVLIIMESCIKDKKNNSIIIFYVTDEKHNIKMTPLPQQNGLARRN